MVTIEPGKHTLIDTGISLKLPTGIYGRVAPCSGLALHHGITVGAGVLNQDYTGNIGILLFNHGENTVTLEAGEHITQLIPEHYLNGSLREVNQIHDTECGMGGFGSTDTTTSTHESCDSETGCGPNCRTAIHPCPDDESEYAHAMEPKLIKIFTIIVVCKKVGTQAFVQLQFSGPCTAKTGGSAF